MSLQNRRESLGPQGFDSCRGKPLPFSTSFPGTVADYASQSCLGSPSFDVPFPGYRRRQNHPDAHSEELAMPPISNHHY